MPEKTGLDSHVDRSLFFFFYYYYSLSALHFLRPEAFVPESRTRSFLPPSLCPLCSSCRTAFLSSPPVVLHSLRYRTVANRHSSGIRSSVIPPVSVTRDRPASTACVSVLRSQTCRRHTETEFADRRSNNQRAIGWIDRSFIRSG